jgi:hypothetical protein
MPMSAIGFPALILQFAAGSVARRYNRAFPGAPLYLLPQPFADEIQQNKAGGYMHREATWWNQ